MKPSLGQRVQKQACCLSCRFPASPRPLTVGQEGKGKRGRERERRREQGDIPQTCQDIPRETIPNISHCDPRCVCAYVYDSCFWGQSDKLTDSLSAPEQSPKHTRCVCGKVRVRKSM
ncbi:hypothetical protein QQF64_002607 [Cirrhinus molitorella]|uniref:Uncharacterized protein n=1 Tax=Cirrhinus molitorella TaxID=172907 RepID=A0ABR3MQQ0_9TELE